MPSSWTMADEQVAMANGSSDPHLIWMESALDAQHPDQAPGARDQIATLMLRASPIARAGVRSGRCGLRS